MIGATYSGGNNEVFAKAQLEPRCSSARGGRVKTRLRIFEVRAALAEEHSPRLSGFGRLECSGLSRRRPLILRAIDLDGLSDSLMLRPSGRRDALEHSRKTFVRRLSPRRAFVLASLERDGEPIQFSSHRNSVVHYSTNPSTTGVQPGGWLHSSTHF